MSSKEEMIEFIKEKVDAASKTVKLTMDQILNVTNGFHYNDDLSIHKVFKAFSIRLMNFYLMNLY